MLARRLHAGLEPETHYDLFIREVTGSKEERDGRQKVTLVPSGRSHEFVRE